MATVILSVTGLGIALLWAVMLQDGEAHVSDGGKTLVATRRNIRDAGSRTLKNERRISVARMGRAPMAISHASVSNQPVRTANKSEDGLLDKVVAELLDAIRDASDAGDYKRVVALVEKLRALSHGTLAKSGCGSSAKRRVLKALEEVGFAGLDQVLDFVNDPDPEIAESATEIVFKSMHDLSLGDYKLAEIVVSAAEEFHDNLSLVRLYQEFIRMRPTVGTETLVRIAASGTEEAKSMLPGMISTFASSTSISTPEALQEWVAERGDPKNADALYGPRSLK